MDEFITAFEGTISVLRSKLKSALSGYKFAGNYKVVWDEFEAIIEPLLIEHLVSVVPGFDPKEITKSASKSTYPDYKVIYGGQQYAIDIKSGEDKIDPWYDMGRLDTYEKDHLVKYASEYYITIKYNQGPDGIGVTDIFIEPAHASVGINPKSGGIKYRPYDGKIRPKSWDDFDNGTIYWPDANTFKTGLEKSRIFRQLEYIKQWYSTMDDTTRSEVKKLIRKIDQS